MGNKAPDTIAGEALFSWLKHQDTRLQSLEQRASVEKTPKQTEQAGGEDAETFMFRTKPEVTECNWQQFKVRFSSTEPPSAIEVLLAGEDLRAEMEDEQLRRVSPKRRQELSQVPRKLETKPQNEKNDAQRLDRVRINSIIILAFLSKVTGDNSWSSTPHKPHTFLKPFKPLIHFHNEMEEEFANLKSKFDPEASVEGSATSSSQPPQTNATDEANPENLLFHTETGTLRAYEDMKCYLEFVKSRLLPKYRMFRDVDPKKPVKVRHDDLWYLFRPGEIVYEPCKDEVNVKDLGSSENPNPYSQALVPSLWRVVYLRLDGDVDWEVDDLDVDPKGILQRNSKEVFPDEKIFVYYIDFDGKSYSAVPRLITIPHYHGERDVTALPIYPLPFAHDQDETVQRLKERGQKFQLVVSQPHDPQSYEGWTLTRDPIGRPLTDRPGINTDYPRHIEGDVIVDFHETYLTRPWWRPDFKRWGPYTNWDTASWIDDFAIYQWADTNRSQLVGKIHEVVVEQDNIYQREWNQLVATDRMLSRANTANGKNDNVLELNDDDLCLLPSRIFVFALRERRFFSVEIRYLKPSSTMENPFENLQIPDKHKNMIESTVFEHFEKKKLQREAAKQNRELPDQDFIGRKGRGLIFLLHGAPGVGKTATAEAVGYAYKKPLFPITCGDLGIEPQNVEATLSDLFRLANLWDCILLFDEAEIFLSRRERKDDNLQRNALVTSKSIDFNPYLSRANYHQFTNIADTIVFLRTLEYYPGILFLTTNRVGALDEAVKSRVHISLFYPYLGEQETLSLFRMNIRRLQRIEQERAEIMASSESRPMIIEEEDILQFARKHFNRHKDDPDTYVDPNQSRFRANTTGREVGSWPISLLTFSLPYFQ